MHRILSVALPIVVFSSGAGCQSPGRSDSSINPDEDFRYSKEAETLVKSRRLKIAEECRRLGETCPWAGDYERGVLESIRLQVAPDAGFVFEWQSDVGLADRNYGRIVFQDNRLILYCELRNPGPYTRGLETEWIPVRWGHQRFLIGSSEMPELCNTFNAGQLPSTTFGSRFLLRCGDDNKTAEGIPSMPSAYQRWLLEKPIDAVVVEVGTPRFETNLKFKVDTDQDVPNTRKLPLKLAVGKRDGVFKGMRFYKAGASDLYPVLVTDVGDNVSHAELQYFGIRETKGAFPDDPSVGCKLSTRPPE
jgi:hypothetical protein